MLLKELASLVGGNLIGDGTLEITGVSPIEEARKGELVFVLEDKYLADALRSGASAMVISGRLSPDGKPAILAGNPRLAMAMILGRFSREPELAVGIDPSAFVHKTAKIGNGVTIGPFAYVGPNSVIGDSSTIYPNVTIYGNVKIGKRCVIHAGARIGVDGYGFVPSGKEFKKIPQVGGVIIGDDVEIYCNTCVARGTLGNTEIGSGTKIDNLTHIAHNCVIGNGCAITGLVGFAGSVVLKDNVSVGGQAGFSGHLTVGENTVIMARAGVTKDIPANSAVSGFPAIDHKKELETQAFIRHLSAGSKKKNK